MKNSEKKKFLEEISRTLIAYDPDYQNIFICPLCLKKISLDDMAEISAAHIFPQASGGKLTTWACCSCNSNLGKDIDKYFGEYLNVIQKKSLFSSVQNVGCFTLDGMKIQGRVQHDKKQINIIIDKKRNSPYIYNSVMNNLSQLKKERSLSVKFPLLGKLSEVDLGFVTAAYLYGFSIFGYSWVMQKHFDSIREAIKNNDISLTKNVFISNIEEDQDEREHYFGIAIIDHVYIPCIKLKTKIVFFSPSYNINALEVLRKKTKYSMEIKRLNSIPNHTYTNPFLLAVGNNVIFFPNKSKNEVPIKFVLLIEPSDFSIKILNTFVDANFEDEYKKTGKPLKKYSINLPNIKEPET